MTTRLLCTMMLLPFREMVSAQSLHCVMELQLSHLEADYSQPSQIIYMSILYTVKVIVIKCHNRNLQKCL